MHYKKPECWSLLEQSLNLPAPVYQLLLLQVSHIQQNSYSSLQPGDYQMQVKKKWYFVVFLFTWVDEMVSLHLVFVSNAKTYIGRNLGFQVCFSLSAGAS